ncbi:MAG: Bax inhibitor-1/YccA family protein [Bacteroidales bacterium]|nr:Bax inhibitor-1/YccA family protein [Bacteroidales bacterium]
MNNYYNIPPTPPSYAESLDQRVSQVMKRVYVKMFLGLLLTAAVAWIVAAVAPEFQMALIQNRWIYWGLFIVEILLVLGISGGVNRLSPSVATGLFFLFAIVNGLTLSLIFVAYSLPSIFKTFLITAGTFGAMSVYGYFTEKDLTKIGSFLYMALWGMIICIVVNIFWANSTLDWIISIAGVIIFIGLTAWDTQKIKTLAAHSAGFNPSALATIGALTLYLDFINLFLYLLRFFGSSRD